MKKRKVLALILSAIMVFGSFTSIYAANDLEDTSTNVVLNDVTNHWGANAINKWVGYGIINGYNGQIRPNDFITRGEMAVILDNMMDFQVIVQNSFTDLKAGKFYTDPILKANAAGIIQGNGVTVRPTDKITREEAAVMLGRAFALEESISSTTTFNDSSSISNWAKGYVTTMQAKGYVGGFNNNFLPKTNITRAETVTMIDNIVKAYYTKAGTYTENVNGIAIIKVSDVTLKGVTISENLIIAEGVGQGEVTLDSVIVKGNTVVRGGGENSVHIVGTSSLSRITIEKVEGKLRIAISDGDMVQEIEVAKGEDIIITGTIGTLDIAASNTTVYATDTDIKRTNITGENSTIIVNSKSEIGTVAVSVTGNHANIQTQKGSEIGIITAEASINVSGKGKVSNVDLKDGADSSSITTPNTKTTVNEGVTGATGGGGKAIAEGSTRTNNAEGDALIRLNGGRTGSGGSGGSSTVAPTNMTGTVAITGTAKFGQILTAVPTLTNAGTPTYQWKRDGVAIGGATSTTYTLVVADIGKVITVTATADGVASTGSITSTATAAIAKADGPTAPSAPTQASKTDTSVTLTANPLHQFSRDSSTWQDSGEFTGLAASTEYTFTARVKETATHLASNASVGTAITTNAPSNMTGTVAITGTAKFGQILTAVPTLTNAGTPTYQWKRDGVAIGGATSSTYTLVVADIGKVITVTATADGVASTGSITSTATAAIAKADGPTAPSAPTQASKTDTSVTLTANPLHQFSRDGSTWQDSGEFTGLTASTEYTFTARVKETATHLASNASVGTAIITAENVAIVAARSALETAQTLSPVQGINTNVITMAQAIVNGAATGVTVTISESSGNTKVGADGAVTYTGEAVTGNVIFALNNGGTEATATMSVVVPANNEEKAMQALTINGLLAADTIGETNNGRVDVTWEVLTAGKITDSAATGYEIYYIDTVTLAGGSLIDATDGVTKVTVSDATTSSITITDLNPSTEYKFVIYAVSNATKSIVSSTVEGTPLDFIAGTKYRYIGTVTIADDAALKNLTAKYNGQYIKYIRYNDRPSSIINSSIETKSQFLNQYTTGVADLIFNTNDTLELIYKWPGSGNRWITVDDNDVKNAFFGSNPTVIPGTDSQN